MLSRGRVAASSLLALPFLLALPARALVGTPVSPRPAATGVCTDTLLTLTFDSVPALGAAGRIRIVDTQTGSDVETIDLAVPNPTRLIGTNATPYNYRPVTVTGTAATIHPKAGVLAPGRTYAVVIDAGVLVDGAGVPWPGLDEAAGWRFTTRTVAPDPSALTLTVAADGTGDFCTVQGAIDHVPVGNTQRRTILIRRGTYGEMLYVGSRKPLLTFRGEDRAGTIIAYANNNNFNAGNNRAMVSVDANDAVFETLTLRNTTPRGGSQAEALRGNGQRVVLDRVTLSSFQDTLLWNGSLFVTDSLIEGDVDFMWGGGAAYFQRCELRSLNAGFLAQVRNGQNGRGFVYVDCRLTAPAGVTNVYLARIDPRPEVANTWPFSEAVFLNCAMGPHVRAEGWQLNNATSAPNVRFFEYRSTDLAGAPLEAGRRLPDSRQLDAAAAAQYRDVNYVLGWTPVLSAAPAAPRPERLSGLSTRGRATGPADGAVIVGFVVAGASAKPVLVRGIGPALAAFGVGDTLRAPRVELFRGAAVIAANAGWGSGAGAADTVAAAARVGVFPLAVGSADAALVATLAPGAYTAVMTDVSGAAGNGLVEIYDLAATDPSQRLGNLSARAVVGTGDATLIAGMTVAGNRPKPVLVRGIGPTLAAFGVGDALRRPQLTLFQGGAVVAQNANWTAAPNALEIARRAAEVGAFNLAGGSGDAALLLELAPGNYTAQVAGVDGDTGAALLEVYELP
ncbi:MAG: Ig-like domain-containing protein [Opitutaceae bacterium]|nr:Ig-like domain-containing protein [Opitutaceae bacterium]